jgi:hypothetical protein
MSVGPLAVKALTLAQSAELLPPLDGLLLPHPATSAAALAAAAVAANTLVIRTAPL